MSHDGENVSPDDLFKEDCSRPLRDFRGCGRPIYWHNDGVVVQTREHAEFALRVLSALPQDKINTDQEYAQAASSALLVLTEYLMKR